MYEFKISLLFLTNQHCRFSLVYSLMLWILIISTGQIASKVSCSDWSYTWIVVRDCWNIPSFIFPILIYIWSDGRPEGQFSEFETYEFAYFVWQDIQMEMQIFLWILSSCRMPKLAVNFYICDHADASDTDSIFYSLSSDTPYSQPGGNITGIFLLEYLDSDCSIKFRQSY